MSALCHKPEGPQAIQNGFKLAKNSSRSVKKTMIFVDRQAMTIPSTGRRLMSRVIQYEDCLIFLSPEFRARGANILSAKVLLAILSPTAVLFT